MGLALMTAIDKSTDASADATARAQVDTVIAVATFDSEGRVVNVIIDNAQTRVNFDEEMQVSSDVTAPIKTKVELGDDYGMGNVSSIGKDWHEQIAALEDWMVGKTVDEINALPLNEGAADLPELTSSVTIRVSPYQAAVAKAFENAVPVSDVATIGLGTLTDISKSKGYALDADGKETLPMAQVDTTIAGTAFDAEGNVVGIQIDVAQTRVNYDAEGVVTSDKTAPVLSKVELGANYGMVNVSSIEKEWFEQTAALEEWMVGKSVDEIKAMEMAEGVPADADLTSSVTIRVGAYLTVLEKAYMTAR
jgi:uncharacterized protein YuzE